MVAANPIAQFPITDPKQRLHKSIMSYFCGEIGKIKCFGKILRLGSHRPSRLDLVLFQRLDIGFANLPERIGGRF